MEKSHFLASKDSTERDRLAGNVASTLHDAVRDLTQMSVTRSDSLVHGMMIAAHAAIAGIHVLARITADGNGVEPLNSTQVLFAALLAYRACPYEIEAGRMQSEYSPMVVYEALNDFERLTGRRPDEDLLSAMCDACRDFASDPKKVAAIARDRAKAMAQAGQSVN